MALSVSVGGPLFLKYVAEIQTTNLPQKTWSFLYSSQGGPHPPGSDLFFCFWGKARAIKSVASSGKGKTRRTENRSVVVGVKGGRRARLQEGNRRQVLEGSEIVLLF